MKEFLGARGMSPALLNAGFPLCRRSHQTVRRVHALSQTSRFVFPRRSTRVRMKKRAIWAGTFVEAHVSLRWHCALFFLDCTNPNKVLDVWHDANEPQADACHTVV